MFIHNKPHINVFAAKGVPHSTARLFPALQIIPFDLVCVHVQGKAASVAGINGGVLRLIGIIYHTILAILDVSMNLHVIVRAEPLVQVGFIVGSPQDGAVQHEL